MSTTQTMYMRSIVADQPVVVQVPAVVSPRSIPGREQPADVGVDEASQRAADAVAVADVRRMGIALLVGERVVLAVVGHPLGHGPCIVMQPRIASAARTGAPASKPLCVK